MIQDRPYSRFDIVSLGFEARCIDGRGMRYLWHADWGLRTDSSGRHTLLFADQALLPEGPWLATELGVRELCEGELWRSRATLRVSRARDRACRPIPERRVLRRVAAAAAGLPLPRAERRRATRVALQPSRQRLTRGRSTARPWVTFASSLPAEPHRREPDRQGRQCGRHGRACTLGQAARLVDDAGAPGSRG